MKYCANCGTPMEETDAVCPNCGTINPHYAGRKKKSRRPVLVGAAAAAVVCALLLCVFNVGSGYRGVVRNYVKAVEKEDGDAMLKLVSPTLIDGSGLDGGYISEYYSRTFEQTMNTYENRVGRNVRLRCELDDFETMEKRERDDFVDGCEAMGYDMSGISKVAEAELVINAKGRDKDREYEEDIILVKENGKWKIWDSNLTFIW